MTLKNLDILDKQVNNESVVVLWNRANVGALENIDILITALEPIVSAAKWFLKL